jgi:hypothetical protein
MRVFENTAFNFVWRRMAIDLTKRWNFRCGKFFENIEKNMLAVECDRIG